MGCYEPRLTAMCVCACVKYEQLCLPHTSRGVGVGGEQRADNMEYVCHIQHSSPIQLPCKTLAQSTP